MSRPDYPAAGTPAAIEVVIASGSDRRSWRRLRSLIEAIGLVALLPIAVVVAALVVFLLKWAVSTASN